MLIGAAPEFYIFWILYTQKTQLTELYKTWACDLVSIELNFYINRGVISIFITDWEVASAHPSLPVFGAIHTANHRRSVQWPETKQEEFGAAEETCERCATLWTDISVDMYCRSLDHLNLILHQNTVYFLVINGDWIEPKPRTALLYKSGSIFLKL